jgi:hypothetical protein
MVWLPAFMRISELFGGLIRVDKRIGPPQEVQIRKSLFLLLMYSITSGAIETSPRLALS